MIETLLQPFEVGVYAQVGAAGGRVAEQFCSTVVSCGCTATVRDHITL